MFPETGRIYHPADEKYGGVGLIKSSLGIELSHCFEYRDRDNGSESPSHFNWNGKTYELDNSAMEWNINCRMKQKILIELHIMFLVNMRLI